MRTLSFGRNGESDINTCSAIALGLMLNCLASATDKVSLAENMKAEKLAGERWDPAAYPNALRLQRCLTDACGLSPRYFFRRFTLGVWGGKVVRGLKRFYGTVGAPASISMKLRIGPGLGKRVRASIDNDLPAMVTTAWSAFDAGRYNTHTMLVYGYRRSAEGVWEYLVHPGWYGGKWIDAKAGRVKEVWLPASAAVMGYWPAV